MTRWPNAGLMLAHRLRRWANIIPALGPRVVEAGIASSLLGEAWWIQERTRELQDQSRAIVIYILCGTDTGLDCVHKITPVKSPISLSGTRP